MTRRRVVFTSANRRRYSTPEFNGDSAEFRYFDMGDTCEKTWWEIASMFSQCENLEDFERVNAETQGFYHGCFPPEIVPIEELALVEDLPTADEHLLLYQIDTRVRYFSRIRGGETALGNIESSVLSSDGSYMCYWIKGRCELIVQSQILEVME